jgi:hypothetical protein
VDLSSLQTATTVFISSHFTGCPEASLLVDISWEGSWRKEAHPRKAKRKEKPLKHAEAEANTSEKAI